MHYLLCQHLIDLLSAHIGTYMKNLTPFLIKCWFHLGDPTQEEIDEHCAKMEKAFQEAEEERKKREEEERVRAGAAEEDDPAGDDAEAERAHAVAEEHEEEEEEEEEEEPDA
jgi:hypothetical protein